MAYIISVDDKKFKVEIDKVDKGYSVRLDNKDFTVEVVDNKGSVLDLIIDNKNYTIFLEDNRVYVGGEEYNIEIIDEKVEGLLKAAKGISDKKQVVLKAPMPGLVVEVEVNQGDKVKSGQGLLIVEAMKMQNEMKAPREGTVKQILVKKGQTVNSGDTLLIIE
ncbi:hypothetical protein BXT86_05275 [candidate division WOR-3 bacterium 4484_100]|uniref:Lipoyl-binding domain-containing protein n=1 Tax=candidate division WOR-3 bacterium 4484_100 TaxID=1936077 RepID=A0A1V4QEA0_UNCW3|nr:MAG: hypothetical protein BXT86_05275 [candidate division WOR-3 bacterium 4484_100]